MSTSAPVKILAEDEGCSARGNDGGGGGGGGGGRGVVAGGGRRKPGRNKLGDVTRPAKRRCVSSACIACRRRKSKCDGNTPTCAACASVYHTECIYDLSSDHRRKGVYKKDIDNLKTQNGTLQTLIEAILNYPEDQVFDLVRQIRTCDSLEDLAESILEEQNQTVAGGNPSNGKGFDRDSPVSPVSIWAEDGDNAIPDSLEAELSGKMGALKLEEGQVRFIGATSNLLLIPSNHGRLDTETHSSAEPFQQPGNPILSWTTVTQDADLIVHLISLYFNYHYPFFTTLSRDLFYKEFHQGQLVDAKRTMYCTPLLVNIMLALGCHFTSWKTARADPEDPATTGDHFFKEAKRIILENDEHETPRLATVQALALMSVREAGCGREGRGWVYSGMSFRMAMDLGLHLDPTALKETDVMSDQEIDARRITFWGCFLFDKCWSNYMGRMPQLPSAMVTVPKPEVFPNEDSDNWVPYTDEGMNIANSQPSRIRAISIHISYLCEISNDILFIFYNPTPNQDLKPPTVKCFSKSNLGSDFKKLSELFTRLENWRKDLPLELDAKDNSLPSALLMHMFHQTLYIHLFRPFLKFSTEDTPLSHLDPRKACLAAATTISKYLRFYKRRYTLNQICNVAGYFIHTACTIHLLNLPQKTAVRDIIQGLKSLEEMGECWLVARRSLVIIDILVRRWQIPLPEEATAILANARPEAKRFGLIENVGLHQSVFSSPSTLTAAYSMPNTPDSIFIRSSLNISASPSPILSRSLLSELHEEKPITASPPSSPSTSASTMSSQRQQQSQKFRYPPSGSPLVSGIYNNTSRNSGGVSLPSPPIHHSHPQRAINSSAMGAPTPITLESSISFLPTHEQQMQAQEWWLRDQGDFGVELARLGDLGWDESTADRWPATWIWDGIA